MLDRQYSDGLEAGVDEAGRGCLAGPVTAAAVILPENINLHQLNDSKKLTHKQREQLRPQIEAQAIAFAVAHVFPDEIDQINILNAAIKAMHLALNQLTQIPSFIAVDGNKFHPYSGISHQCIVKGDGKYMNIAAASVLAKTYRDEYMAILDQEYPHYDWKQNKGYPTRKHREALQKFGTTSHHRKSFQLLPKQLVLKL
jgi:ribonuclease HII